MKLSQTVEGQDWLSQFMTDDQEQAAILLDRMLVVATSELREWLGKALLAHSSRTSPLALYAEREFARGSRFFSNMNPGPVRRAIGTRGPALIKPKRGSAHVGSESIMAQLITELVRRESRRFLISPGPDRLRPMKSRGAIRRLAILTDAIGTGDRIYRMLDALWKTETIRSWYSHRNVDLQLLVIGYAASAAGYSRVEGHRLAPTVLVAKMAPAIGDYPADQLLSDEVMKDLCHRYDPRPYKEDPGPLGYKDAGTLLAFAHGCPNTTPRLFWRNGSRWRAIFPERSAVPMETIFQKASILDFAERLSAIGHGALADRTILAHFNEQAREALLLLAALSHGIRDTARLATRTGLMVPTILTLLEAYRKAGWIDARGAITKQGLQELRAAERLGDKPNVVPPDPISVYFPQSLRG